MKKILLSAVLGVAVVAVGQNPAPPAQGQPATPPAQGQAAAPAQGQPASQAPVIKDPAEYNAYVAAVQQKDPQAKISGMEAFLTQYPNSVMKQQALEILMQSYQQANNAQKATETAQKLVEANPCQVPALTLLAYIDRMRAQGGDPNGKQLSADAEKYGQQGLGCLDKFQKPEGTSDADFQKMKAQMTGNFDSAVGWGALQDKDYPKAAQSLKAAVEANPPDSQRDLALLSPGTGLSATESPRLSERHLVRRSGRRRCSAAEPTGTREIRSLAIREVSPGRGWLGHRLQCGQGRRPSSAHSAAAHSSGSGPRDGDQDPAG